METPPYKFHKNKTESKLEITANVEDGLRFLQLYNVHITPFDQRFNIRLEIWIAGDLKPLYTVLLSDLFHNPKLEPHIFFVVDDKKFRTIALPSGYKKVLLKVISLSDKEDFEMSLQCDYAMTTSRI